jgi:hypothetical protein
VEENLSRSGIAVQFTCHHYQQNSADCGGRTKKKKSYESIGGLRRESGHDASCYQQNAESAHSEDHITSRGIYARVVR